VCSPEAAARGEERRRWRPQRVQGSDKWISKEGQTVVLGSHLEFKEPTVLVAVRRSMARGSNRGGAKGGQGGRRYARSE
jgi:hypothetical protein